MQSAQDQLDGIRQLKAKLFEDDQRAMRQGSPLPIAERVRAAESSVRILVWHIEQLLQRQIEIINQKADIG